MATLHNPQQPLETLTTTGVQYSVASRTPVQDLDMNKDPQQQRQNRLFGGSMAALAEALDAALEDQQHFEHQRVKQRMYSAQREKHKPAAGRASAATTSSRPGHPLSQAKHQQCEPATTTTLNSNYFDFDLTERRDCAASGSSTTSVKSGSRHPFSSLAAATTSSTLGSSAFAVSDSATAIHTPPHSITRTRETLPNDARRPISSHTTTAALSSSERSLFTSYSQPFPSSSSLSVVTSSPLPGSLMPVSSNLLLPSHRINHSPIRKTKRHRSRSIVRRLSSIPSVPPIPPTAFALAAVVQQYQKQQIKDHQQKLHGPKNPLLRFLEDPLIPTNLSHEPAFYNDADSDEEEQDEEESSFPKHLDSDLALARALAPALELGSLVQSAASNSPFGPFYNSPTTFQDADIDSDVVNDEEEDEPTSAGSTFLHQDETTLATELDFDFDFDQVKTHESPALVDSIKPASPHGSSCHISTVTVTKTEPASASIYIPDTSSLFSAHSVSLDTRSDRTSTITTAASLANEPVVVYTTATAVRAATVRPEVVQVRRGQSRPASPQDMPTGSEIPVLRVRHIVEPEILEGRIAAAVAASAVADLSPSVSTQTLNERFRAAAAIAARTPVLVDPSNLQTSSKHRNQYSQDSGKRHAGTPSRPGRRLTHSKSYSAANAAAYHQSPAMMHQASSSSLRVAKPNIFNHGHTASNSTIASMMSDGSSPNGRRIVPPEKMSVVDFESLPPTIQRKYFSEGERLQFAKARASEESQSNTSRPNSQPQPTSSKCLISSRNQSPTPLQRPSTPVKVTATTLAAAIDKSADEFPSPKIFPTPGRIFHSAKLSSHSKRHKHKDSSTGNKVSKPKNTNIVDSIRRRSRANSLDSSFYAALPDKIQRRHLDVEEQVIAARHRRRSQRLPTLNYSDKFTLDWTRRRPSSNPTPPQSVYGEEGFVASPSRAAPYRHRSSFDFDFRLREDEDEELDNPFQKRITVLLSPTVGPDSTINSPDMTGLATQFLPSPLPSPFPPVSPLSRLPLRQSPSSPAAVSGHRPSMSTPNATLGSTKNNRKGNFMDSFQWLEEEEDFDLKLHLDDYHANLHAQLPASNGKTRPSFRRHLSINKMPFSHGNREGPAPIQVGPYGPIQNKRRSRALSLITPRQSHSVASDQLNSPISPMDETAHYSDPNARLKLRLYLASPEKFEEAIQYGFPAAAADPKSPVLPLSIQNHSFRDSMSMVSPKTKSPNTEYLMDEKLCTFLADEESSVCSADEDVMRSSPEFDTPPTPQSFFDQPQHSSEITRRFNTPTSHVVPPTASSIVPNKLQPPDFETTLASREMTLRMTLTRPDLRDNDDQMYGWKTQVTTHIHSTSSSQATSRQPSPTLTHQKNAYEVASSAASVTSGERGYSPTSFAAVGSGLGIGGVVPGMPTRGVRDSTVAKENIERQFAAFDADMEADRGMMKRIWHKVRRN